MSDGMGLIDSRSSGVARLTRVVRIGAAAMVIGICVAAAAVVLAGATAASGRGADVARGMVPLTQGAAVRTIGTKDGSVASAAAPRCPLGQLPILDISTFPQGGTHGATTPEAALRAADAGVGAFTAIPMGKHPQAPVWIEAGTATFIATVLPDGSWFVSRARFVGCQSATR